MKCASLVKTLRTELDDALGLKIKSLTRIFEGASSLNFKAVKENGDSFLIKIYPKERHQYYYTLIKNLELTKGTKAVKRIYEDSEVSIEGMLVLCLEWARGISTPPDKLNFNMLKTFAADYKKFSNSLQKSTWAFSPWPLLEFREKVMNARGVSAAIVKRLVEKEISKESLIYKPDNLKVIHGDFHGGNFTCENDGIGTIFDLEECRIGLPAEDIVRYIVCAVEHLCWYNQFRKRKMFAAFSAFINVFEFSKKDWETAVKACWIRKISLKVKRGKLSPFQVVNVLFVSRVYRNLLRIVGEMN